MAEENTENTSKSAEDQTPPSTVDQQAPDVAEENAPSTSEDVATDIPSANAPDPQAMNPEVNPNATGEKSSTVAATPDDSAQVQSEPQKTAQTPKEKSGTKAEGKPARERAAQKADDEASADGADDKPAAKGAKAKKEKPPAVEDKPFADFIQQDYLPSLQKSLAKQGIEDLDLKFEKQKLPIRGLNESTEYWQVIGHWQQGSRQFYVAFLKEDIQGQRIFSFADNGAKPSTLEPFLNDERKITLDLLVFGVVQRLNAQKWLARN